MENIINYVGWKPPNYNLGDEALYIVDQEIFAKYNLRLQRITDPLRQEHSQTTLIGGSTSLPLISMYMRPTKYVYVFGSGVEDPLFYDYVNQELIERLRSLKFRFIGVRGRISKTTLREWGINSEVIGDPCLTQKPTEALERCSTRIAVNVGDARAEHSSSESRGKVVRELVKVCKVLKADGYELILIPFWKENMEDIKSLSEQAHIRVFTNWQNIEATMNLLSSCKMFIGEKLHSLVFSAAANTPFIGLAYAPEHFDFTDSVGFSNFTMATTATTAEKILVLFDEIINNYETTQNRLAAHVNDYREKQRRFAAKIVSDIESLPEDKWDTQNSYGNTFMLGADFLLYGRAKKIWNAWNRLVFSNLMPHLI